MGAGAASADAGRPGHHVARTGLPGQRVGRRPSRGGSDPPVESGVLPPQPSRHGALGISNEMPVTEMIVESEVMALADGPTEVHRSRSPASTRNRIHGIDTTDLVTAESALDSSGRLATC